MKISEMSAAELKRVLNRPGNNVEQAFKRGWIEVVKGIKTPSEYTRKTNKDYHNYLAGKKAARKSIPSK
jgi:hypothetical protein